MNVRSHCLFNIDFYIMEHGKNNDQKGDRQEYQNMGNFRRIEMPCCLPKQTPED